jgi:hypothetical protein
MDIMNLHITSRYSRDDHDNVGDAMCAPLLYFDFPGYGKKFGDVRAWSDEPDAPIILGGGGIIYHSLLGIYNTKIPKMRHPVIFWGGGDNMESVGPYPEWMSKIALTGVRDYGSELPWVPCASCMHPAFNDPPAPTKDMVVYDHWQWRVPIDGFDRMRNDCTDFEAVIKFLASGATIYTSSYHGIYWGALLGRKVILSPHLTRSTRWLRIKHKPTVVSEASRWREARDAARVYPEALSECRDSNTAFHKKVMDLLS